MAQHQKTENPVSPSIAIELTSKNVTAYFDGEVATRPFENPINFKNEKGCKALGQQLKELTIPDRIRERKDTFWTIGIPDNSSQEARKGIKDAFEEFRRLLLKSPVEELAPSENKEFTKSSEKKKEQPPIRLINRSTAGAIGYLQSLRDQERLSSENEGDVDPYLLHRHFSTIFVDGRQIYGAEFETLDGLVQHKHSFHFKDENFEAIIINLEKADEENLIATLSSLWTMVHHELKNDKKNNPDVPVLFTWNTTSYLIQSSGIQALPSEYYTKPADKFSLFPSINNKPQHWNVPNRFILKGINVKTRMLAGDADMIDYDVPSGFIGEAIIEVKEKFRASLIQDGEKLPIHRTIFEMTKPMQFEVNLRTSFGTVTEYKINIPHKRFICKVDENGIIKSF